MIGESSTQNPPSSDGAHLDQFALHNVVTVARLQIKILQASLCKDAAGIMADQGRPYRQLDL